jgi:hypothetical protein
MYARENCSDASDPNVAGKTTTINMLTGLARPDTGTIKIGGLECTHNPKAAQHLVGVFIAVSVSEIFEAQTFSNFFRFPMFFLCGLFFPIDALPAFARPISYALPLTYGVDILHGAIHQGNTMPLTLDLVAIGIFCVALFFISVRNIHRKWIV